MSFFFSFCRLLELTLTILPWHARVPWQNLLCLPPWKKKSVKKQGKNQVSERVRNLNKKCFQRNEKVLCKYIHHWSFLMHTRCFQMVCTLFSCIANICTTQWSMSCVYNVFPSLKLGMCTTNTESCSMLLSRAFHTLAWTVLARLTPFAQPNTKPYFIFICIINWNLLLLYARSGLHINSHQ